MITFEHDHYHDVSVRDHSRAFLMQQGYQLVVSDVAYNRVNSYEDWWVHPELTDPATIDRLRDLEPGVKYAPDYMLNRR